MATLYEASYNNIAHLVKFYSKHKKKLNEATTRWKLIDTLFLKCLGWNKQDCKIEDRFNGKYTDYIFSNPYDILVVEAKKTGIYFKIPAGMQNKKYKLELLIKDHPKIGKAIKQAMQYCQERGVPFGSVCNGHQLIVFIGSRNDGTPPLKGYALVMESLLQMQQEFNYLWNSLSKPGISTYQLMQELQEDRQLYIPTKMSAAINNYPGYKNRNPLETNLKVLGDFIIEDIARMQDNEVEFLKDCYCKSGALSQYSLVSKKILEARYSNLFEKTIKGPTMQPVKNGANLKEKFIADSLGARPILFLGDVGVGKTIFLRHFIKIDASDVMKKAIFFYIDYGTQPVLTDNLKQFIATEINRQLMDFYKIDIENRNFIHGVYHGDLLRFEKGLYSDIRKTQTELFRQKQIEFLEKKITDTENHLKKCLTHLYKGHKKQLIMFFDNVDQRSDDFQEKVFIEAQSIAQNWPVFVFLALRPETFYRSSKRGVLSAYHPKAFTVAPPRLDNVIQRRLKFAISLLKEKKAFSTLAPDITVKAEGLQLYLETILYSFENNRDLTEFVDNMCGGNVRLALGFINSFIGSGHVDTKKILDIIKSGEPYQIPLHEFMRAVIFGDNEHFEPISSVFLNLFDVVHMDGREHFLLCLLIAYMEKQGILLQFEGFVPVLDLYKYAQNLGYHPLQIEVSLKRAEDKKLIESNAKIYNEKESLKITHYRVTTTGVYHIKRLVRMFTYMDAIIVDTPILSAKYSNKIVNTFNIEKRLDRTKIFCDYLDEQWQSVSSVSKIFDWLNASSAIREEIQKISYHINYSSKKK